ncbi:MAG TPA: GNAT family N-acetyltransferase, partial [Bacteroidales bacterium]|nr:GNAT family N-acetyltransferase [Bacteroidales bacterium]
MNLSILRFDFTQEGTPTALQIRHEVFVVEQQVPEALEYDGLDPQCLHYLLLADEKPVATARWRETEKGIKLERFAVLQEFRSMGLGGRLLDEVLADVIPLGKRIYLHSQDTAVAFYERHGFVCRG